MVRILIEAGMSGGFEDEAYRTVRGMNSNNTVAFSHKFFTALEKGEDWKLRWVTDPTHVSETFPAKHLWDKVVYSTWFSADPGIHATDTINEWHTCPQDGRIVSSNPCSEYLLNETACNLASLNLTKFYDETTRFFDTETFRKAVNIWQTALDITVSMAQYPAEDICTKSVEYRTTGLGYTNLGGLLMLMGYGYDSDSGRQVAGAITAILGGQSYSWSSVMARKLERTLRLIVIVTIICESFAIIVRQRMERQTTKASSRLQRDCRINHFLPNLPTFLLPHEMHGIAR